MAWKYKTRTIRAGKAWTDDNGVQHPRNWMIWSDADKKSAGLTWEMILHHLIIASTGVEMRKVH